MSDSVPEVPQDHPQSEPTIGPPPGHPFEHIPPFNNMKYPASFWEHRFWTDFPYHLDGPKSDPAGATVANPAGGNPAANNGQSKMAIENLLNPAPPTDNGQSGRWNQ
jgi:hypothetical protein